MKTMRRSFCDLNFPQGHKISGDKTYSLHASDTMFSIKLKFSMNVICFHMYSHIGIADQPQKRKFTQIYHIAECESFEHLLFLFIHVCIKPYGVKMRINLKVALKNDTFILLARIKHENNQNLLTVIS